MVILAGRSNALVTAWLRLLAGIGADGQPTRTVAFSYHFILLRDFIKAVHEKPNPDYGSSLGSDGRLLPRFCGRTVPDAQPVTRRQQSLQQDPLLSGARNDSSLVMVDNTPNGDGDAIGSVEIGIDQAALHVKSM